MKFAFLIMGDFDMIRDRAAIGEKGTAQMIGVSSLEDACTVAKELYQQGVDCIELCGAFGEGGAKKVIEATENKLPVCYVTHLPEQEEIYQLAFKRNNISI